MSDTPRPPDNSANEPGSGPALIPEVLERADVESGAYSDTSSGEARQSIPRYSIPQNRIKIWSCSPGCILIALLICIILAFGITQIF